MARELEQNNFTSFTPHYITWICPEPYRDSDECQSQCIHNGRYCTPDPDGDLEVSAWPPECLCWQHSSAQLVLLATKQHSFKLLRPRWGNVCLHFL